MKFCFKKTLKLGSTRSFWSLWEGLKFLGRWKMNRCGRNLSCQNLEWSLRILGKDTLLVGASFVLFFRGEWHKDPNIPHQQVIIFLTKWGSCLYKNLCALYLQSFRFSFTGRIWFVEDIISPFKENVCCKREFLHCLSLPHLHLPILSELKIHIADKVPNTDK